MDVVYKWLNLTHSNKFNRLLSKHNKHSKLYNRRRLALIHNNYSKPSNRYKWLNNSYKIAKTRPKLVRMLSRTLNSNKLNNKCKRHANKWVWSKQTENKVNPVKKRGSLHGDPLFFMVYMLHFSSSYGTISSS